MFIGFAAWLAASNAQIYSVPSSVAPGNATLSNLVTVLSPTVRALPGTVMTDGLSLSPGLIRFNGLS
jgi:hypothetical protein